MFSGVYEMKLGRDGRLTVPKRMRLILGDSAVVTQVMPDCLTVLTKSDFESLLDYLNRQGRVSSGCDNYELALARAMYGKAYDLRLDGKGRFRVPDPLRRAAQLEADVSVVGAGNRIEIWSSRLWERLVREMSEIH